MSSDNNASKGQQSWYGKIVGRSLFSVVFGGFFENKNNSASIIGIVLVITLCYVIVVDKKFEYMQGLLNVVFVVIGYYFGAKEGSSDDS